MASSSNLEILVTFRILVVQDGVTRGTVVLTMDSLRTIGHVIDEVARRYDVDTLQSQFRVIKGGKLLTRDMTLEDADVQKQDTFHVIIKTIDGHVSSRTRSRSNARASTS